MNIQKMRKKVEATQQDLATYLGVTERTIRNWESGAVVPKKGMLGYMRLFAQSFKKQ